jgi:hypothetical protein
VLVKILSVVAIVAVIIIDKKNEAIEARQNVAINEDEMA